jgi:hypothetical protein
MKGVEIDMDNLGIWAIYMPYRQEKIAIDSNNFTIISKDLNQISGYVKIKENISIDGFEIYDVFYNAKASIDFIWHVYVTFIKDEDGKILGKLHENELNGIKLCKYYGDESIDEKDFAEMIQYEYEMGSLLVGDFTLVNMIELFY